MDSLVFSVMGDITAPPLIAITIVSAIYNLRRDILNHRLSSLNLVCVELYMAM